MGEMGGFTEENRCVRVVCCVCCCCGVFFIIYFIFFIYHLKLCKKHSSRVCEASSKIKYLSLVIPEYILVTFNFICHLFIVVYRYTYTWAELCFTLLPFISRKCVSPDFICSHLSTCFALD